MARCSGKVAENLRHGGGKSPCRWQNRCDLCKATLQMVNHLVEVAVSLSDYQVQDMSWFDFLDEIKESELIQYLKERRLYVNEPVNASEEE